MRALVAAGDPGRPLEFAELEGPRASATELVVEVEASSVNHGEVEWLRYAPAGWRAGWDVSGRVAEAATGGLDIGTRVVCFLGEAGWAERVAVPLDRVGVLPDGCSTLAAAAIPVVGLTALRALRVGGLAAGKRVAVLGAGGAIGRVAIQLAARFDAEVTAVTRDPAAAGSHLTALGAAAVTDDPSPGRYDVVLDAVGGAVGSAAVKRLAPEGVYVVYGNAAGAPIELDPGTFFGEAPEARIHSLRMDASRGQERFGADLSYLAGLVAAGELDLEVDEPRDWGEAAALVAAIAAGERPARKPLITIGDRA